MRADRRMEADNYLSGGYGIRLGIESQPDGWAPLADTANVWQPSRLKGIQVATEFGAPYLAATQVFEARPTPRKWLALERTKAAGQLFVKSGTILVTRSGTVGRTTLAFAPHLNTIISDDLLRVEARDERLMGWLYAYLRSSNAREMMTSAQYGHVIKHLECAHLNSLPVPMPREGRLEYFNSAVNTILEGRERAHALVGEAEATFTAAVGEINHSVDPEKGFEVTSDSISNKRRRLEAGYHNPRSIDILNHFKRKKLPTELLSAVTERVWWMTRFKRVFGDAGVPYFSAEELFSINPRIIKRVLIEQAENAEAFFVKAGWIVMACSGQAYGMLGSVSLMTEHHEGFFFSHDLIRIKPIKGRIHPGYLFMTLGHPRLGRPLLIRYAYGTSIPHLEPSDISTFPIVRLDESVEQSIGEKMKTAAVLRIQADDLENRIAAEADDIIQTFIGRGRKPKLYST